jgi:hypothetical protein
VIRDFCFVGSESVEDLLPLGNADFLHNKVLAVSSHSTTEYMSLLKCNLSNYWKIGRTKQSFVLSTDIQHRPFRFKITKIIAHVIR